MQVCIQHAGVILACKCVFSMQVCFQHAGVFAACIVLVQTVPLNSGWWHLDCWHVFQVRIVLAKLFSLDMNLMAVSMVAGIYCMWYKSLHLMTLQSL